MKTKLRALLIGIAITTAPLSATANHIKAPTVPDRSLFTLSRELTTPCGVFEQYTLRDNDSLWSLHYLKGGKHPLLIWHRVREPLKEALTENMWLDRDQDGHIDEFETDLKKMFTKYQTPCDASTLK